MFLKFSRSFSQVVSFFRTDIGDTGPPPRLRVEDVDLQGFGGVGGGGEGGR